MSLSPPSPRRRGGAVVRARQNVQTLEHQTQANVLLAFKLSMVSGNGLNSTASRPSYRTYRKMSDIGVQYEPQEPEAETPIVNSTVAEINTSAEIVELENSTTLNSHPPLHRPLSLESATSSSSGEERERRKPVTSEELDVDAIHVQQCAAEDESAPQLNNIRKVEKTEPDGFVPPEKEESNCGLDCVSFAMQCCECTIL